MMRSPVRRMPLDGLAKSQDVLDLFAGREHCQVVRHGHRDVVVVHGEFGRVFPLREHELFRILPDEVLDDMRTGDEVSFPDGEGGSRVLSLLVDDLPDRKVSGALSRHRLWRRTGKSAHQQQE